VGRTQIFPSLSFFDTDHPPARGENSEFETS